MNIRAFVGLTLMAVPPVLAEEPRKGDVQLVQPSPKPPTSRPGPLKGLLASGARAAGPPAGELSSLRAVSLREGSGVVSVAGTSRTVRPGDRIGGATVKAIGSDRIILERAGAASAALTAPPSVLIVITFGAGGEARVRTYTALAEAPPVPETR